MSFELGQVVMTRGIAIEIKEDEDFGVFVYECFKRHRDGNFTEEDMRANVAAIKNGDRVFSVFEKDDWKIYIITEWDRSYTTILLPDEY